MQKDKILGMMMGIGIGDALGSPVECLTQSQIWDKYPDGLEQYEDGRKKAGSVTDDANLTMATMLGLILGQGYNMDFVARSHVEMYRLDENAGYGASTREAIRRIANGVSWKSSGIPEDSQKVYGLGNGVPMKVAPIAALFLNQVNNQFVVDFSAMTHYTKMSAYAALVHTHVLYRLLLGVNQILPVIRCVREFCEQNPQMFDHLTDHSDNIWDRFDLLENVDQMSFEDIANTFNGGTYYVYDSLPYVYAHWLKHQEKSMQSMFDCINYCGEFRSDTDSNASMLGGMLGAYYGNFFPTRFIVELSVNREMADLVNRFCLELGQ